MPINDGDIRAALLALLEQEGLKAQQEIEALPQPERELLEATPEQKEKMGHILKERNRGLTILARVAGWLICILVLTSLTATVYADRGSFLYMTFQNMAEFGSFGFNPVKGKENATPGPMGVFTYIPEGFVQTEYQDEMVGDILMVRHMRYELQGDENAFFDYTESSSDGGKVDTENGNIENITVQGHYPAILIKKDYGTFQSIIVLWAREDRGCMLITPLDETEALKVINHMKYKK
jgi:hypothetical protein